MTRMGLTTFLLNDSFDSASQATRLSKYADEPGGRDYHWAAKLGAERIFLGGMAFDQAVAETMVNISRPHQRRDNQDALKSLNDWKFANPGNPVAPPSGAIAGPRGELNVVLKPAFALEIKGITTALVPWMYKDIRLSSHVAGMGVHLLEAGLKSGSYASWRFGLIDTVTGKCFVKTLKRSGAAAAFALRAQEEMLIALKKAA